ncbi:MAG: EAL domain-containing protein [Oscillospiraceae bacterium]|nr:EAL domain-containing protein [Oscillospiraceae bacterium]
MNIQIQSFGLFILALLYIFYKSSRTLQLYSEKVFRRTLYISIISLALDILSLIGIGFMEHLPEILVICVCKLYIMSLVWEAVSALSYVMTDLYSEKKHVQITRLLWLLAFVQSIVVAFLPISIYKSDEAVYTYGLSVLFVYAFSILHIIGTVVVIFSCCNKINKRRRFAVALWVTIWIVAAVIQYLDNSILIVGFASVVGMLILFVVMENPESNLDRRTGCFNSYALSEFSHQLFERKTKFGLLEICLKDSDSQESDELTEGALKKMASMAAKNKELYVFRNVNDLIVISENVEMLREFSNVLISRIEALSEFTKGHAAVLVEHGENFSQMGELFQFLAFVNSSYAETSEKMYVADESAINKYRERSLIEQEISDALAEDRVEVYLQPIYSNTENKFTSAEALVRIRKIDGSLLSPGLFIPIAESSGQIVRLGERVFEKVCCFLKNTNAVSLGIHYVEVNLSVVQCEMADLADRLISIIEKYGVDPALINLEITESASVTSRTVLLRNMEKLIEYGFTFSLDDFGKGQSNLMYVVEMPVSIIKLDYDMSKAFFSSPKAKQVVRAVVSMAHGMNLKLVAEGIETEEEIDGMNRESIDYIQGFYYSKPLPMPEFLAFIHG